MINKLTFRELEERDVSDVFFIDKEAFADPWGEEYFKGCINDAFHSVLCALDPSGETVGYITASSVASESEILRIAVSKSHRGLGIGGVLLDAFIEERRTKGDEVIFLEVRRSNAPAVSLYRSRGFTVYAERANYYKNPTEDALLMRLEI